MINEAKLFKLKGGDHYITEKCGDAFRIHKGTVLVYIVPWKKEGMGRRSFLYEAQEGEVIPGLFHTDMGGGQWRFCLDRKSVV